MNKTTVAADFIARARRGEAVNVVFFRGSLTWGAGETDPDLTSWHGRTMEMLIVPENPPDGVPGVMRWNSFLLNSSDSCRIKSE